MSTAPVEKNIGVRIKLSEMSLQIYNEKKNQNNQEEGKKAEQFHLKNSFWTVPAKEPSAASKKTRSSSKSRARTATYLK